MGVDVRPSALHSTVSCTDCCFPGVRVPSVPVQWVPVPSVSPELFWSSHFSSSFSFQSYRGFEFSIHTSTLFPLPDRTTWQSIYSTIAEDTTRFCQLSHSATSVRRTVRAKCQVKAIHLHLCFARAPCTEHRAPSTVLRRILDLYYLYVCTRCMLLSLYVCARCMCRACVLVSLDPRGGRLQLSNNISDQYSPEIK